jgi:hypothetical protein
MMRKTILTLTAAALTAGTVAADPITDKQLNLLVKRLETSAERWLAGRGEDEGVLTDLDDVQYPADSLPLLKQHLTARRADPVDLYVANRLLRPLVPRDDVQSPAADPELIRLLIPTVQAIRGRARMLPFVQYPPSHLRRLKLPEYKGNVSPEKLMADVMHFEQLRGQKMSADRKVALHNREVVELTLTTAELILLADRPAFDQVLVRMVAQEEQAKSKAYEDILRRIRDAAGELSRQRATVLYKGLLPLGAQLRMARKEYIDFTKPMVMGDENSYYGRQRDDKGKLKGKPSWGYPGIEILGAVNQLAAKAGLQAQDLPSKDEIDAMYRSRGED